MQHQVRHLPDIRARKAVGHTVCSPVTANHRTKRAPYDHECNRLRISSKRTWR